MCFISKKFTLHKKKEIRKLKKLFQVERIIWDNKTICIHASYLIKFLIKTAATLEHF